MNHHGDDAQSVHGELHHHHADGHHPSFDERAREWDEPHRIARAEAISQRIVETLTPLPSARALDYGCGTGLGTWPMAEHFAHITLADSSPGMLEVVRERIAQRPDPQRFTVAQLDVTVDELAAGSVEYIYTVMTMHHVDPLSVALSRFYAALTPGGALAIADLDAQGAQDYHSSEAFDGHPGFDRDDLSAQLLQAGFTDVSFETVYVVQKAVEGRERPFPVFLAVARKEPGAA